MLGRLKAGLAAQLGAAAETRAEAHLKRQGLIPVTRNWRCSLGELDLVMRDGETLVIVEVKARSTTSHGGALASLTAAKRGKLFRTALAYTQAHPEWQDAPLRFDVVRFESDGKGRWLRAAFTTDDAA